MTDLKVGRPKIAIAGGVLAIVCAVVSPLWLLFGLIAGLSWGYFQLSERFIFFGSIFVGIVLVCCVMVFVGGIVILRRKYKLGGVLALIFSILLVTSTSAAIWYVAMWGIIGGILSLISREKIPERVLEVAKRDGRVSIKEVATETGKTEADIEVAIIKLRSKGQPVSFDMKTREVIYDG